MKLKKLILNVLAWFVKAPFLVAILFMFFGLAVMIAFSCLVNWAWNRSES